MVGICMVVRPLAIDAAIIRTIPYYQWACGKTLLCRFGVFLFYITIFVQITNIVFLNTVLLAGFWCCQGWNVAFGVFFTKRPEKLLVWRFNSFGNGWCRPQTNGLLNHQNGRNHSNNKRQPFTCFLLSGEKAVPLKPWSNKWTMRAAGKINVIEAGLPNDCWPGWSWSLNAHWASLRQPLSKPFDFKNQVVSKSPN